MKIGLPAVIFTEHLDFARTWRAEPEDLMPHQRKFIDAEGLVDLPEFDAAGYFETIARCRHQFPELRVLTGVEFGQPHLFGAEAVTLLDLSQLDRVNGSLHTLRMGSTRMGSTRAEPSTLFREHPAAEVMWAYLAEIPVMVRGSDIFDVFTHIDYAVRCWPIEDIGPFDPKPFEEGFRSGMRSIAESGRALEMNTRRLWPWIPQWWSEEGGRAISFGSDAHTPEAIASNFPEAVAMVEHFGFQPGSTPEAFWTR